LHTIFYTHDTFAGLLLQPQACYTSGNCNKLFPLILDSCTGAVGGVHLLPVYPSSGDGGFAPLRYDQVDPHFGDWSDVEVRLFGQNTSGCSGMLLFRP
jgi:hypothetical protein